MVRLIIFISVVLGFISCSNNSLEKKEIFSGDTVRFSSERVGLYVWTHNIDSIKYYQEKNKQINPFSPSMIDLSAPVYTYVPASLVINVKDKDQKIIVTFIWNSISPGAYRFDWWQYIYHLPHDVYFIEKIINGNSETYKAYFI